MKRIGLTVAVLAVASAAIAAGPAWQSIGPDGGPIVSLLRDPMRPSILWVSTGRIGVLRSEDDGGSWTPANDGLPTLQTTQIVLSAAGLLLGTQGGGLFESGDSGSTWTRVGGLPGTFVLDLAVDPRFRSIVYAWSDDHLYQSRDGGVHWSLLPAGGSPIVVDPSNSRVFAGGSWSADLGATWHSIAGVSNGGPIRDFLADVADPDVLDSRGYTKRLVQEPGPRRDLATCRLFPGDRGDGSLRWT